MTTSPRGYDVLVAGAGPAGLSTAVSAARHGARVLVVERHPTTSVHPRATGISTRTMEIFRGWGIADAVRAASTDVSIDAGVGQTLADPALTASPSGYPAPREALAVSPALPASCAQDRVEPVLLAEVRRSGGEVRFGTELTDLHTGPDEVRATLTDRATGAVHRVHARYVVGADGPRSAVRTALGIGVEYLGSMGEFAQVVFRADLTAVLGSRRFAVYVLSHPEAEGLIISFGPGRWGYARQWYPERGESAADFTPERWTELLRTATGLSDLRPEIVDAMPFTLAAELALSCHAGRGFLVGDAAHRMTPVGAVGLNTAIHDGHNLGWKLAWAVRGLAGEALLDSYAEERRPVGERNTRRSLRGGQPDPSDGLPGDLGSRYRSAVIAADAADGPEFASPHLATASPGERAPHVWVTHDGRRRSMLDLFEEGRFTLVVGRRGRGWRRAVDVLARTGPPLVALTADVDVTDPHGRLARAYRLAETGAVLVRPDGYVAWRCDVAVADPVTVLENAVGVALGRPAARIALAG